MNVHNNGGILDQGALDVFAAAPKHLRFLRPKLLNATNAVMTTIARSIEIVFVTDIK